MPAWLSCARPALDTERRELPEAQDLNAGYVSRIQRKRPFVRIKIAASLDGRTAMASGESRWITGPEARADVQYWRARSCAIITGSGTVLTDDPQLTVRDREFAVQGEIRQPLRVVTDTGLRIPADAALLKTDGPVLLAHGAGSKPAIAGVEHMAFGTGPVDLNGLLGELAARGCNEVLVEAGPTLVGAFSPKGCGRASALCCAEAAGSDARPLAQLPLIAMDAAVGATIRDFVQVGDDLRLRLLPQS